MRISLFFITLGLSPLFAQPNQSTKMQEEIISFSEGIEILLSQNAKVLQSNAVVLQFKALEAQAKGAALPSWTILAAIAPVIGGGGNAVDGRMDPKRWGAYFLGNVELLVPVFTFGRIRNSKKAANLGVAASLNLKQDKINSTLFEYKKLYLSLILLKRYRLVLDEAKKTLDQISTSAKKLYRTGKGSVQQKDIARLEIVAIEFAKLESEWQLNHNRARLGMGHMLGKTTMVNIPDNDFPSVAKDKRVLDDFVALGYKENPLWHAANQGVEASELVLKAEKRINYPVVAVGARLQGGVSSAHEDQKSPFAYDPYNKIEGTVFLAAQWKFDFSLQKSQVLKAQSKLEELRGQKQEALTGIPFQISEAYWKIEKFEKYWQLSIKKYKEASKWALSELSAYSLGATDAKDLIEALVAMNMAAQEMADAEFQYNLSLAELSWRVGESTSLKKWQEK